MSFQEKSKPFIERLALKLRQRNAKLVTAESCTGGLVASWLTEISGSSSWYWGGYVTYQNETKVRNLGVARQLLEQYGAVSEPVAKAMAAGALVQSQVEFSVAVTGIAGPNSDDSGQPVGTVWLAWGALDSVKTKKLKLTGSRRSIREQATYEAIVGLLAS